MPDREKVIKGLEICKERNYCCPKCPYYDRNAEMGCHSNELMADALALLKEQEAVVRCKDCVRRGTYQCPVYVGGDEMCSEPDDWFCADGEKRQEGK